MADKQDVKTYILTIEYNEKTEEIEYIQEELVNEDDLADNILRVLSVDDFDWDETSLSVIKKFYTGEIGES